MKLKDLLKLPVQGQIEVVVYEDGDYEEAFWKVYDLGDIPGCGAPATYGLSREDRAELKPYMNYEVKYCFSREYGRYADGVVVTCFRVELVKEVA